MSNVREPAVAGLFYSGSARQLKLDVLSFLKDVSLPQIPGELIALVVPHAGLTYSGRVAAHAYRVLQETVFDTAILIGPNHQGLGFPGTSVYAKGAFKTPLGEFKIDEDLAEMILCKDTGSVFNAVSHAKEHSLEVQIPFLQIIASHMKIVPIVMADYDWKTCSRLANAIVHAILAKKQKKIILIVSTDLSHYFSYEEAIRKDRIAIQDIESMDPGRLYMDAAKEERAELCGFGPMLTALLAVRELGANAVKTLNFANSGDVTGDKTKVVGYVSMAIFKRSLEDERLLAEMEEEFLSGLEKKSLCEFARRTLEVSLGKKKKTGSIPSNPKFLQKKGVFVTLKKDEHLRGCIGFVNANKSLLESVKDLVLAAAFQDSRFSRVRKEELDHIQIEISILSDFVLIQSLREIKIGKHGIFVKKGARSGLFLPQVATEEGWNREEFLSQACLKAGMNPHEWKKGCDIFIFTTFKCSESKSPAIDKS